MECVDAKYIAQTGEPFLDALPPPVMLPDLIKTLRCVPELPKNLGSMSATERFALTRRIADVYIPMDYAATIYNLLYAGICSAYKGTSRTSFIGQMNNMGRIAQSHAKAGIPDNPVQAECFSVLGEAGMGKTVTIQKILSMMPQLIRHESYEGYPFEEYQICYLKIECPSNNSPRGACLQILSAIGSILGTDFSEIAQRRNTNLDMLITRIAQLCVRFHVGCIIIDEVQNILRNDRIAPASSSPMVKFMVEIANKTGACIVFVGTPTVAPHFDAEPHLARRTRGPRIPYLPYGEAFGAITEAMWNCAPLLRQQPLNEQLKQAVYKITSGSIAKTKKLIQQAAQQAIYFGNEQITGELLRKVAKQQNIIPAKSMMEADAPVLIEASSTSKKHTAHSMCGVNKKSTQGRKPKKKDPRNLIDAFDECHSKGWPVAQKLISMGIAERMVV